MLTFTIEEFIEEITNEIIGYEELGEEKAKEWENNFRNLLENNNLKRNIFMVDENKKNLTVINEEEIFGLADTFLQSVLENSEDEYWESLKNQ